MHLPYFIRIIRQLYPDCPLKCLQVFIYFRLYHCLLNVLFNFIYYDIMILSTFPSYIKLYMMFFSNLKIYSHPYLPLTIIIMARSLGQIGLLNASSFVPLFSWIFPVSPPPLTFLIQFHLQARTIIRLPHVLMA